MEICSQEVLLAAVHAPVASRRTVPLPAPLPTITELVPKAKLELELLNVKVAVAEPALALTVNGPAMPLAVRPGAVALPFWSVVMGIGGLELNTALAPPAPGVTWKFTGASRTGTPPASVTNTCRDPGNG